VDATAFVRNTPVTIAQAARERVEAIETTVGRLEATSAPALAAETSGAWCGCMWMAAAW